MSLPLLEPELRPVPREEFIKRLKTNIKTPKQEGVSSLGKPDWLKIRPPTDTYHDLRSRLRELGLVTVCQESHCPNMAECWSGGTATFMILGDTCTRACKFCAVKARGQPEPPDPDEPRKIVEAVGLMKARYVVLTCVDRDDLPDGGASHWFTVISELKKAYPDVLVEALIGDFQGNEEHLKTVLDSGVDVLAHNVETVKRLQSTVRDRRANYAQSLGVLRNAKMMRPDIKTKSSLMVGLGETYEELCEAMDDLRAVDCDIITFGQYLRPSTWHLPVERYMPPEEFKRLESDARDKGFLYCAAGPFVRSSYRAAELFAEGLLRQK